MEVIILETASDVANKGADICAALLNTGRSFSMFKRDLDLERKWNSLLGELETVIGKKPKDLNSVLFLIGVQELGHGTKIFSKEEKQDLIHIGICKVLSLAGYYILEGLDKDGWPHWNIKETIPHLEGKQQNKLMTEAIVDYFRNNGFIE